MTEHCLRLSVSLLFQMCSLGLVGVCPYQMCSLDRDACVHVCSFQTFSPGLDAGCDDPDVLANIGVVVA